MTALEGGDFEEGVRRMNRVLAVRGQVVPASPRRRSTSTPELGRRDASSTASRRSCARDGIERVWVTPDGRARVARTPSRPSPRRTSSCSARAACTRASCRACSCPRSATRARGAGAAVYVCNVATQAGETRASTWPTTSRRSSPTPAPGRRRRARERPVRRADARRGWRGRAGPAPLAAGRASRVPRLVLDDVVDPDNAHHHDPDRLARRVAPGLRARERRRAAATGRRADAPDR